MSDLEARVLFCLCFTAILYAIVFLALPNA